MLYNCVALRCALRVRGLLLCGAWAADVRASGVVSPLGC